MSKHARKRGALPGKSETPGIFAVQVRSTTRGRPVLRWQARWTETRTGKARSKLIPPYIARDEDARTVWLRELLAKERAAEQSLDEATQRRAIRRARKRLTYTYVIGARELSPYVKIGKSNDPLARLDGGQTWQPFELRTLIVIEGDVENDIHTALTGQRKRGEWFRVPPESVSRMWEHPETCVACLCSMPRNWLRNPRRRCEQHSATEPSARAKFAADLIRSLRDEKISQAQNQGLTSTCPETMSPPPVH